MKRYLFLLITLLPLLGYAQEEGGVCYQQSDSITICRLLNEAHSMPRTTNFPLPSTGLYHACGDGHSPDALCLSSSFHLA